MVGIEKEMQVNAVWRFYLDQDRKWRWQRLTVHQMVISESHAAYMDYEKCMADAQKNGYVFHSSFSKRIQN